MLSNLENRTPLLLKHETFPLPQPYIVWPFYVPSHFTCFPIRIPEIHLLFPALPFIFVYSSSPSGAEAPLSYFPPPLYSSIHQLQAVVFAMKFLFLDTLFPLYSSIHQATGGGFCYDVSIFLRSVFTRENKYFASSGDA